MAIDILYVGRIEYGHALDLQMDLWKKVSSGESRDTLILLEHPEVITLGVRGKKENILMTLRNTYSMNRHNWKVDWSL